VNLAGAWGIAMARRGALEDATRAFQAATAARALALDSLLSSLRADLAFVTASSELARLSPVDATASERRAGATSALLLFLRGHPEVIRVIARSASGAPLLHTGRRGGVPVFWVSSSPTGEEGAARAPDRPRLTSLLAVPAEGPPGAVSVELEIEPASLLERRVASVDGEPACLLRDAKGELLAKHPLHPAQAPGGGVAAEAVVHAEGWSAPAPWRLGCSQGESSVMGLAEPLVARYRTTFLLNLGVMGLALLLGTFAVQQSVKRERLEARGHEEARVRELERQLFHAERLTTVGRLAAGIAHEINNPLEGMANYLALARDALAGADTAGAERHLASVRDGLERAAGIVRQVLAHADPAKVPATPLDLNEVLRETGQFVASRKEFGTIAFALELAPERLLVRGSAVMLGQVAVNLILNACEAQPRGGQVLVRSRRDGSHVVAEIGDRGPGVGEADRQRIFEPFFSTKDSTGLGLSICHSIVRQHDGEVSVLPREGGGALFRIRLPALEA
jgi:signal transduction histidine kinase